MRRPDIIPRLAFRRRRGFATRRRSRAETAPPTWLEFAQGIGALLAIAMAVILAAHFAFRLAGQ